jgi:hypothetical protein
VAEIEVARDWLDYSEAFGAVVSFLLAAMALWFAKPAPPTRRA